MNYSCLLCNSYLTHLDNERRTSFCSKCYTHGISRFAIEVRGGLCSSIRMEFDDDYQISIFALL